MACLADNNLGGAGAASIGSALVAGGSGTSLNLLDLSLNNLGDEGAKVSLRSIVCMLCPFAQHAMYHTCTLVSKEFQVLPAYRPQVIWQVLSHV